MNDDIFSKINLAVSVVLVIVAFIVLSIARKAEGNLRKTVVELESKMSQIERKIDSISANLPILKKLR